MEKVRLNVIGRVQGVGFRFMTKIAADRLGVYGSVKNERDGSVTIEAIAQPDVLAQFIAVIKASPSPSGKVEHVTVVKDATIKDSLKFSVLYS